MCADVIAAFTIETESRTCQLAVAFVHADDFDQAFEAAERWRTRLAKVDQHLFVYDRFGYVVENDRRHRSQGVMRSTVRQKSDRRMSPERLADSLRGLAVGGEDHHSQTP